MPPTVVTGAAGFIGRRLVARLLAGGEEVCAVVRPGRRADVPAGADVLEGDVADAALGERVAGLAPRRVFHLAVRRDGSEADVARTNVVGTAVMLEAAAGAERFVHVGGALEYGASEEALAEERPLEPIGYYGATKAAATLLCRARTDVDAVVLRPFLVYGPGQAEDRLIPTLLRAARSGEPVTVVAGPARDWIHVDDVVDAALALAGADVGPGTVVNAGTGEQWRNEEVVAAVERATGRTLAVTYGGEARAWDRETWRADPTKLREVLGIEPRPLEEGLAQTWAA